MACPGNPLEDMQSQIDKLKTENTDLRKDVKIYRNGCKFGNELYVELTTTIADLKESLRWLVISETTRFDECQSILEPGSKGGYSPEMLKAMELVEDK